MRFIEKKDLKYRCQRFSNNNPRFTDQEAITNLYSMHVKCRFKVKEIMVKSLVL